MKPLALSCLLALVLPLTACTVPAADYRMHYGDDGVYSSELRRSYAGYYPPPPSGRWIWQPDLRLYTSAREPSLYYRDDGLFLRWNNGRWGQAPRMQGPWRSLDARHLPAPLHHRHGQYREAERRSLHGLQHERQRLHREREWQRQQQDAERRQLEHQRRQVHQQRLEMQRERQRLEERQRQLRQVQHQESERWRAQHTDREARREAREARREAYRERRQRDEMPHHEGREERRGEWRRD